MSFHFSNESPMSSPDLYRQQYDYSDFVFDLPASFDLFGDEGSSPTSLESPASSVEGDMSSPPFESFELAPPSRTSTTFVLPANPFPRRNSASSASSSSSDRMAPRPSSSATICPLLLNSPPSSPSSSSSYSDSESSSSAAFLPHPHPIRRPKTQRPHSNSERRQHEIQQLSRWVSRSSSPSSAIKRPGTSRKHSKTVVVRAPYDCPRSSARDLLQALERAETMAALPTAGRFPFEVEKYRLILRGIQETGFGEL